MMDESGLELGLSLSCGISWSQSKVKDTILDLKRVEGNASRHMGSNMSVSDDSFKNFFKSELENHDPKGKQKSDSIHYKQENFFTDLSKCSSPTEDCSNDARSKPQFTRYQELWLLSNRTVETEEEVSRFSKRKLFFEEINFQNKHVKLIDYTENHGNNCTEAPSSRNSHDSTGEHEEAAESEAEGPKSWLVLLREEEQAERSEAFNLNGKYVLSESSGAGLLCQKQPFLSENESKPNFEKVCLGVPLMLHPLPVVSEPHSVPAIEPSTSVMQLMPVANGEPSVAPPVNTNSLKLGFSYPSVRHPMLEEGSSWAFNSQSLHVSSFTSREDSVGALNQEGFEDVVKTSEGSTTHTSTGSSSCDGKLPDLKIASLIESGDSAQGDGSKPRNPSRTTTNEATNKPTEDGFIGDGPSVKPGVAPFLELSGSSGSIPDLPRVSDKGEGPNGRTISGDAFKADQNGRKVVCACHGIYMSQEEFVQHANGNGLSCSQINPNLSTFTGNGTVS